MLKKLRKLESLNQKVVWITGASSGIGEALAYAFAKKGALLVISARRDEELARVRGKCEGAKQVEVVVLDLEKTDELPKKVERVITKMGRLDILINCSGLSQRSFAADSSIEVYRRLMEVNYFGTVQLTLAVLPYFVRQNSGMFVAMSSVTGKLGLPLRTAYSASKHAVEGFFSALRAELWKTKIEILVVRAGAVKTHIAQNALRGDGKAFNKKDQIIENGIPADDCAKAIMEAVVEGRKELTVASPGERLLFAVNRFLPAVAFNLIKKLGDKGVDSTNP